MTTIDPSKDIKRADILRRIEQELPDAAVPEMNNPTADIDFVVVHSGNKQAVNAVNPWSLGLDEARLGDGNLYVQDFISLNRDITDNDITDTIVSTALRCTQVRRAKYLQVYPTSQTEAVRLFHLDIAAQQWYEEFNQLGRKYSLEAGRDVVKTGVLGKLPNNGSSAQYTTDDLDPSAIKGALELVANVLNWHRKNGTILDIRTCHGDCHGNCHGNRSRR